MAPLINPNTLRTARASCPFLHSTPSTQLRTLATSNVNGANGLALRAIGCPIMAKAIAQRTVESIQKRSYAQQAPREDIDEIHRQHGVKPGTRGICPTALEGYNAAQAANKVAATEGKKPADPLLYAPPAQAPFDYEGFYQEELDKKHRDKSYRCVRLVPAVSGWQLIGTRTATLTTSIVSRANFQSLTRLGRRMRLRCGARMTTWAWVVTKRSSSR